MKGGLKHSSQCALNIPSHRLAESRKHADSPTHENIVQYVFPQAPRDTRAICKPPPALQHLVVAHNNVNPGR
jgi:hypothetical protein